LRQVVLPTGSSQDNAEHEHWQHIGPEHLAVETLGLQQVHQLHPERNELGLHGRLRLENMEDGHAFRSKSSFGGRGRPGIPSMGATDEYGYDIL